MENVTRTVELLTCSAALEMVQTAIAHARKNGWNISVIILDPNGNSLASARMDGVAPAISEIAADKAFTAALGKSSKAFYERMSSADDLRLGLQNRPRFCAWEGGLPIELNGTLVGAIGVSGAKGHEDAECAQAAIEALPSA